MAQRTMQVLREIGVLDEVSATAGGGVVRYPRATVSEPMLGRSIGIQGVWFNWYCGQQRARGLPVPAQMSDVPKAEVKAAKAQVAELAQTRFKDMIVMIRPMSYSSRRGKVVERIGVYTEAGNLFGLLIPGGEGTINGNQQITLKVAITSDGSVRAVWE